MTAPAAACEYCGRKHRSDATAAKCAATALRSTTQPPAAARAATAPRPARLTGRDVLDVLALRDGRLVVGSTGGVLAVAPSIPGFGRLPRQIATNVDVVQVLVDLSGADPDEVVRALNQALRLGRPLSQLIPERLLDAVVAELNTAAAAVADEAFGTTYATQTTLRSAA